MNNKYATKRAKKQHKETAVTQKTCADCHWLRSTKCIDVFECLNNKNGDLRLVPRYFKQKESGRVRRKSKWEWNK